MKDRLKRKVFTTLICSLFALGWGIGLTLHFIVANTNIILAMLCIGVASFHLGLCTVIYLDNKE